MFMCYTDIFQPLCAASGAPLPTVRWTKNGQRVTDGKIETRVASGVVNSTLTLTRFTPGQSDSYSCEIRNTANKFVSAKTKIEWRQCDNPGIPNNGKRIESEFQAGETVTFLCNNGYTLVGSVKIQCQMNGQWTKSKPLCRRSCADPGYIVGGLRAGNLFLEGEKVTYHCFGDDYYLIGSRELTCLSNGLWSSSNPSCRYIGYIEQSAVLHGKYSYLQKLKSWLSNVAPVRSTKWRLCWQGSNHGFAVSTFHTRCDNRGPTVTIVRVGSYIFGGYTDQSWGGSCRYKRSSKSFLFTLYNTHGYVPQKLHLISSSKYQYAIYTCSTYGPTFGGHDLHIMNNANTNTGSHTYSGVAYQAPHGCPNGVSKCSVLAGSYNKWKVSDIEVFYMYS